ncbi:MAG: hypothetical protein IJW85_03375, partial [Clostridia bacterium]|nr:hypothetical protein [Clostridia bacterium]
MKRLLLVILLLCSLWSVACAVPNPEDVARETLQAAHPDYTMLDFDQWGDAAAAVLGKGEERILCVAEGHSGEWEIVVDNPKALPAGAEVSLLMDSDISLYWSIPGKVADVTWMYSCFRGAWEWGEVDCIRMELSTTQMVETSLYWENDMLKHVTEYRDTNENFLRREE